MKSGTGIKRAIVAIAVLVCMGTAYAALSTNAKVNGYAMINPEAKMEIVLESDNGSVVNRRAGESIGYTGSDKLSVSYHVFLIEPNDLRQIRFKLHNTGDLPAQVTGMSTTNAVSPYSVGGQLPEGIFIQTPSFSGITFPPSNNPYPQDFIMTIGWLPNNNEVYFPIAFELSVTTTLEYSI